MKSPKVDVIIPTRNRSAMTVRAVQSVLEQDYEDFHVWVVDDASTDDTRQAIENITDSRISYLLHNERRGGSAARNTGIEASAGPFVAFLDSDDEWLPGKLSRQVALLESDSADVVYCGFETVDDDLDLVNYAVNTTSPLSTYDRLLTGWCPATTSLFIVRRTCLEKQGMFDTELRGFQDYDLWIRLAQACRFALLPERLVRKHAHSGPQITNDIPGRTESVQVFMDKWSSAIDASGGPGASLAVRNKLLAQVEATSIRDATRRRDRFQAMSHLRRYAKLVGLRQVVGSPGLLIRSTLGDSAYVKLHRLRARVRTSGDS